MGPGKAIGIAGKALGLDPQYCISLSKSLTKYESDDEDEDISSYEKQMWILDHIKDEENEELIELAKKFVGIIFGYGKHASALIVLNEPISKFCSTERQVDSKTGEVHYVAAANFKYLEEIGLMKLDMLGLKTLDVIQDTLDMIPEDITMDNIPMKDTLVSEMLCQGKTKGCFQISSPGMTQLVKQIRPKGFRDLIPLVSLYRPGPLGAIVEETNNTMVQTYIKVKNWTELQQWITEGNEESQWPLWKDNGGPLKEEDIIEPFYLHEKLKPILENTYSIILYQEQILEIAKQLCGYSLGEADMLRRIIGKKKVDEMGPALETMIERGVNNRIPRDVMNKVTHQIVEFASYCFNKCLASNERLFRGTGGKFVPTLKEMWLIKNDKDYAIEHGHKDLHDKYNRYGYGTGRSLFPDGKIKKNQIKDIFPSGTASIYRMTTTTGKIIDCTLNHKILTPNGEVILGDLNVGDSVYIMGDYELTAKSYNFYKDGTKKSNVPKKGQMGFQRDPFGNSVLFDNAKMFFKNLKMPCEKCGKAGAQRYELHHKDMNRDNNLNENLEWLCASCHKISHYERGRTKMGERGSSAIVDTIKSIDFIREDEVFDVEMDAPHNFVNLGGVVVHNSHSAGYGKVSWITSYLKAKYPLQFMLSCINNECGNQEKTLPFIEECAKLKIKVLPPSLDKGSLEWVIEDGNLRMGLGYIKGIGKNLAIKQYDDFISVVEANSKSVTEALLKAGALDYLGIDRGLMLENLVALQDTMKREKQCRAKVDENKALLRDAERNDDEKAAKKYRRQLKQWQDKLKEVKFEQSISAEEYDPVAGEISVLGMTFMAVPRIKEGTLTKVFTKLDRRDKEMAWLTLKTPKYGEFRCTVFASGWSKIKDDVEQGQTYKFVVNDKGILEEISINGVIVKLNERRF